MIPREAELVSKFYQRVKYKVLQAAHIYKHTLFTACLLYSCWDSHHSPVALCLDVEVNYMDDVGQTLLNWASAFGTQEMVSHMYFTPTESQMSN